MKAVRVANGGVADASHSGSVEGHVLFDVLDVGVGDEGRLAKTAFAFAVLVLEQVPFTLSTTEDFARTSDLEAFGNGFPCLCFSGYSWHGAGNLGIRGWVAREKWAFLRNPKYSSFPLKSGWSGGFPASSIRLEWPPISLLSLSTLPSGRLSRLRMAQS